MSKLTDELEEMRNKAIDETDVSKYIDSIVMELKMAARRGKRVAYIRPGFVPEKLYNIVMTKLNKLGIHSTGSKEGITVSF